MKPAALMIYVPDIDQGLHWYQQALPTAKRVHIASENFSLLMIGDFSIEVVQADCKGQTGKRGTVLYWSVDCLDTAIAHFKSLGATLYRGPMKIENQLRICQVEDPFGNLIGLRGQ